MHGNGMGTFKIIDRSTEGLANVMALLHIVLHLEGDNFGIRCNGIRNGAGLIFVNLFQTLEIIDISIQTNMDNTEPRFIARPGAVIHGMTVGFGNGPHRSPSSMGLYRMITNGKKSQKMQQLIITDLLSQESDIVTQPADFRCDFVNEGNGTEACAAGIPDCIEVDACVTKDFRIGAFFQSGQ